VFGSLVIAETIPRNLRGARRGGGMDLSAGRGKDREAARMGRKRKELLSSAPWRTGEAAEDEDAARMSREGSSASPATPGRRPP
jgi:hypothetical protein